MIETLGGNEILSREGAREYFKNHGLTYNNITQSDIFLLMSLTGKELQKADMAGEVSIYKYDISLRFDVEYKDNGTIKSCYLFADGEYFKERECISFNVDGFIGFAGWASYNNVKPILRAFIKWCDELAKEG